MFRTRQHVSHPPACFDPPASFELSKRFRVWHQLAKLVPTREVGANERSWCQLGKLMPTREVDANERS